MPLFRPAEYAHNNPNYSIVDIRNVRGAVMSVETLTEIINVPSDKRSGIQLVFTHTNDTFYKFTGSYSEGGVVLGQYTPYLIDDAVWMDLNNWEAIAVGGGNSGVDGANTLQEVTESGNTTNQGIVIEDLGLQVTGNTTIDGDLTVSNGNSFITDKIQDTPTSLTIGFSNGGSVSIDNTGVIIKDNNGNDSLTLKDDGVIAPNQEINLISGSTTGKILVTKEYLEEYANDLSNGAATTDNSYVSNVSLSGLTDGDGNRTGFDTLDFIGVNNATNNNVDLSPVRELKNNLQPTISLGGVNVSDSFAPGDDMETILRKLLIKYIEPRIQLQIKSNGSNVNQAPLVGETITWDEFGFTVTNDSEGFGVNNLILTSPTSNATLGYDNPYTDISGNTYNVGQTIDLLSTSSLSLTDGFGTRIFNLSGTRANNNNAGTVSSSFGITFSDRILIGTTSIANVIDTVTTNSISADFFHDPNTNVLDSSAIKIATKSSKANNNEWEVELENNQGINFKSDAHRTFIAVPTTFGEPKEITQGPTPVRTAFKLTSNGEAYKQSFNMFDSATTSREYYIYISTSTGPYDNKVILKIKN